MCTLFIQGYLSSCPGSFKDAKVLESFLQRIAYYENQSYEYAEFEPKPYRFQILNEIFKIENGRCKYSLYAS